jgi:hypothetical protein
MCPNILTTIKSIAEFKNNDLRNYFSTYPIRINAVGQQLEFYVKDAICGSFESAKSETLAHKRGIFSYLGNQNNPPDLIISNGDAYEIKKIQTLKASLALNNSPPKDRLHRNDPRITQHCRDAEGGNWTSKEIFYVVGCTQDGKLKHLFFVHGRCYAAEKEIYEKKASRLKSNIDAFFKSEGLETTKTIELGRINRIDPLGITNFRIRGMWEIENPLKVFSYLYKFDERKSFSLVAVMTKEKYDSFPKEDRVALESNSQIKSRTVNGGFLISFFRILPSSKDVDFGVIKFLLKFFSQQTSSITSF